ncbi:hypothetical protein CAEBREN_14207 [Caenorhabditis brenneri]|uniref:Peptidase M13 C-terminal domain-containing protein n=1 Tax=Caenorhabditis brenneri TaxID=135651 RepID=G0P626_CAEBE|nr:hypothetical protein CAEBREN_14207 [Caenorhabditis brenneri]
MSAKGKKCSNPLLPLVIFLVIIIVAILAAFIILRSGDLHTIGSREPLVASETKENTTTTTSTINTKEVTKKAQTPTSTTELTTTTYQTTTVTTPVTTSRPPIPTVPPRNVCESPECITLAHQLHNWADPSVDPCVDFYKSACGKYNEHTVVDGTRESKKTIIMKRLIKDMLSNMARLGQNVFGLFEFSPQFTPVLLVKPVVSREFDGHKIGKIVMELINITGALPGQDTIDKDYRDFLALETELRKYPNELSFGTTEWHELKTQIPSVNFDRILESLMNENRKKTLGTKMKDRKLVYKNDLFFGSDGNLESIIQNTPKRTLANFLIFNFIARSMDDIVLEKDAAVARSCEQEVIKHLPQASLRVFVRNYFDKENLKIVSEMIEETKQNFIETIQESTWLHIETKKNAILKIEKMKTMVGYPEEFETAGALDKTFEALNVSPADSYYTIIRKIRRFDVEQMMEYVALETPLDPSVNIFSVNAFYNALENSLAILVPFLDDPLFDFTYPKYAKIAGTGNVLSHEMGHGFDTFGKYIDENGEGKERWNSEDSEEYTRKEECLKDQYSNYDDPDFGRRNHCAPRDLSPVGAAKTRIHPTDSFRVNGVFSNMKAFAEVFDCPVGSPMNPEKKCELF